jgi:superfamily I DNA/RNA helicase
MSTETLTTKEPKTSKFTPSKYQKDIFKFILNDNKNGLISAVAGSGKTTTLIQSLEIIPDDKSVLFLAFNKSISEEISKRVPKNKYIDVKTVHSFGYSVLSSNIETVIEPDKYRLVYKNVINFISGKDLESIKQYNFDKEHTSYIESIKKFMDGKDLYDTNFRNNVNKLVNLSRLHFTDFDTFSIGISELKMIAIKNSIESNDYECEVSWYISKLGINVNNIIDYTDMIFLPNVLKFNVPKYDFVFIDECQDLSTCQRLLMLQAVKPEIGRFIAVGDQKQCQPYGTKVLTWGDKYVNIEDLNVGDLVVTYDRKSSTFQDTTQERYKDFFQRVEKIHHRKVNEDIIKITTDNKETKYTKNHICYVKFKNKDPRWCVYLMQKGNKYKVGICNLWSNFGKGQSGFNSRVRHERGEKLWILEIYNNKQDAYIKEQIISYTYGIPQLIFKDNSNIKTIKQDEIDLIYNSIPNLEEKVRNCLNDHKKEYDYPMYLKNNNGRTSSFYLFEIYACNIFPSEMLMGVYDKEYKHNSLKRKQKNTIKWMEIEKFEFEKYNGYVVSLQISKNENYVADGILTHNCVYAFAGADSESYEKLRQLPNTKELPLSVTYRCGKEIVEQVKHINPLIKPHTKNGKGTVLETFSYLDIEDGDMVLCRNTFPIVSLCINFLCKGRKAFIIGSDIGLSLKNMIRNCENKSEPFNMDNVLSRLHHEKQKMIDKVMTKNGVSSKEASEESSIILFKEKIEIINALSDDIEDPLVVMKKIDEIFSDNKKQGICLSNIHKSKGLESDRVFILHQELMPSKRAVLPWEVEQENNLIYVAYTRAKKTLGFITDYDAWASSKQKNVKKFNESKHVGSPNSKLPLELTILDMRKINTTYGETIIFDMVDNDGNKFFKFGDIPGHFFKNRTEINKIGSRVSFYAIIKDHSMFKGENVTRISNLSIY